MLTADDLLPHRPHRVLVAGASGSGKTTFAARLGRTLGLPHTELDRLYHGPGWVPRPAFLEDVAALAAQEAWVAEWQYAAARPLLAERADTLVWLDLPFRVTLSRVVRRTIRRRLRREELWNGNFEAPLHTFLTDPEHVVRWSIKTRHLLEDLVRAQARRSPRLTVVRLRSRADVERWLERVVTAYAAGP